MLAIRKWIWVWVWRRSQRKTRAIIFGRLSPGVSKASDTNSQANDHTSHVTSVTSDSQRLKQGLKFNNEDTTRRIEAVEDMTWTNCNDCGTWYPTCASKMFASPIYFLLQQRLGYHELAHAVPRLPRRTANIPWQTSRRTTEVGAPSRYQASMDFFSSRAPGVSRVQTASLTLEQSHWSSWSVGTMLCERDPLLLPSMYPPTGFLRLIIT